MYPTCLFDFHQNLKNKTLNLHVLSKRGENGRSKSKLGQVVRVENDSSLPCPWATHPEHPLLCWPFNNDHTTQLIS